MNNSDFFGSMLGPLFAQVTLTFVVVFKLFYDRTREMRQRKIKPQRLSTANATSQTLLQVQSADNFKNLFELPVLFYILCLISLQIQWTNTLVLVGAWVFVLGRSLHSFIHCTYNRVTHRFAAYLVSSLSLIALWIGLLVHFLTK